MLNFNKYRNRFKEIYPNLDEWEIEEIFNLRVNFFNMIVESYIHLDIDKNIK
jgi:hypothetical protein